MKCPKCGSSTEMMVDVIVKMPSEMESKLSKTAFRKKEVEILGVAWYKARYFCKCGWVWKQ